MEVEVGEGQVLLQDGVKGVGGARMVSRSWSSAAGGWTSCIFFSFIRTKFKRTSSLRFSKILRTNHMLKTPYFCICSKVEFKGSNSENWHKKPYFG